MSFNAPARVYMYFSSLAQPFFSFFFPMSDISFSPLDSTWEWRNMTWYRIRNIPTQLCYAPDDSQLLGRLGVNASAAPVYLGLFAFSLFIIFHSLFICNSFTLTEKLKQL